MGVAECARRTGLTARALRVYECAGLIQPSRNAKGWRFYGQKDLVRLNAIIALKSLGLTLGQMREALTGSQLAVRSVLRLQTEVWQKRKVRSEEGLKLVRAALMSLDARDRLSIEDLCSLARSMDMTNLRQQTREAINQAITAEEERAWTTWWTQQPESTVQAMQDYAAEQRAILGEVAKLQAAGADPTSEEAQHIAQQWVTNISKHNVRPVLVEALTWNQDLTRKWMNLGERLSAQTAGEPPVSRQKIWLFLRSALKTSPLGRALATLITDTKSLPSTQMSADAPAAAALATRLQQICDQNGLGDPITYARWVCYMGAISDAGQSEALPRADEAAWRFLVDACRKLPSPTAETA